MQQTKNVQIMTFGQAPKTVEVKPGATVQEILAAANINPSGLTFRSGGREVSLTDVIEGTQLLLSGNIQGNGQQ